MNQQSFLSRFSIRFILVIAIFALTIIIPTSIQAQQAVLAEVTFAAFGDYGSAGTNELAVANLVDSWNPDFIITTGDNSYGSTAIDDNIGQYYSDYIGNYTGSYGSGSLTDRFFPSVGNHDYTDGGGINAHYSYFTLPGNERYYDFVQGPVHFFVIDSNPAGIGTPAAPGDGRSATSAQAVWLQAGLAASTSPWKIVTMHHPPYSSSTSHGSEIEMQWPYEDWGATAVFAGHDHVYERIIRDDNSDGVDFAYFTTGAGGRSLYSFGTPVAGSQVRYNSDYGSMLVTASDTEITFDFWSVASGGTLIDTYTMSAPPPDLTCETFDSFTVGTTVGSHADWYDGGSGPVVNASGGVASSQGLGPASPIFTWMAHPFFWDDAATTGFKAQMDFQTSATGQFDDDRIGWMIDANSTNSDLIFGVQLDNASGHLRMEGYWDHIINVDEDIRVEMADLDGAGLTADTWYRLAAEFTKLTDTSAQIDAELWLLDGSGDPLSLVASGTIPDTSTILPDTDRPDVNYFDGELWPAYKNYSSAAGSADNACYKVVSGAPPVQYTLTASDDGNGSVTLNPVGGTYNEGTTVTLTPVPNTGYAFDTWSGADAGDLSDNGDGTWNITMDANKTVTATFTETPPPDLTCETFDSFTVGTTVGSHADWYDGGSGPVVNASGGVASSQGLGPATSIFTWVAHPFDWNAADFQSVQLQADFQTDASGHFDDDRIGWMTSDSSTSSNNILGVQMDPGGGGYNIEAYWDGNTVGDDGGRSSIVTLPTLTGDAWYRFYAEITRLTATSARIDVTLTELDASGNPGTVVASGSIPDTDLLPNTPGEEIPNPAYFTGPIWPAYKNYTTAAANVDNTCFKVVSGVPPVQYDLTVNYDGNGVVDLDPPGGLYDAGTPVQLTATADPGWTFNDWSGDVISTTNPVQITMDANKVVTATFTQDEYTLTLLTNGDGTAAADPVGPYNYGEVITLTATADPGWSFTDWSGDVISTTNPVQITMDANKVVTATFADNTPPNTTITAHPPDPSKSTDASFSFVSTSPGSTFECQLDGGGFSTCTSPKVYTGLDEGDHTFEVRAMDGAGNTDPTPASYSWAINWVVFVPVIMN